MPRIRIRCQCGRASIVNETMVGQWLRCPDCGQMTYVTWPKRRLETAPTEAEGPPPRVRLPLPLKIALGNLPFVLLATYAAQQALRDQNPLAAAGAILAALVPIVTVQAVLLSGAGRFLRVKDIGLEPAAHAAIVAVGVQLILGAIGYLGALTAYTLGGPTAGRAAALAALALVGVTGLLSFARVLRTGLVRALVLTGVAGAVLAVGGLGLEPVVRVLFAQVPAFLTSTTQPATQPATKRAPFGRIPSESKTARPQGSGAPFDAEAGGGGGN